jgi:hypothetical protein
MVVQKRACLVYVASTANQRSLMRQQLEAEGYQVCEVEARLDDALIAKGGSKDLPEAMTKCIEGAKTCVFLLPEDPKQDGLLGAGAGFADQLDKHFVGIVCGKRDYAPKVFEEHADSVVSCDSAHIPEAIHGKEVFEKPDGSPRERRKIDHITCQ